MLDFFLTCPKIKSYQSFLLSVSFAPILLTYPLISTLDSSDCKGFPNSYFKLWRRSCYEHPDCVVSGSILRRCNAFAWLEGLVFGLPCLEDRQIREHTRQRKYFKVSIPQQGLLIPRTRIQNEDGSYGVKTREINLIGSSLNSRLNL
jgi:hypothetical protein